MITRIIQGFTRYFIIRFQQMSKPKHGEGKWFSQWATASKQWNLPLRVCVLNHHTSSLVLLSSRPGSRSYTLSLIELLSGKTFSLPVFPERSALAYKEAEFELGSPLQILSSRPESWVIKQSDIGSGISAFPPSSVTAGKLLNLSDPSFPVLASVS